MATAISGLGALTTPVTGDLIEIVDVSDTSMSANGTNKKITFENLLSNWDGWQPANETWTYTSASTFTVSGDVAAKYGVGTRVKFTQTTVKYGVVVSSSYSAPNTTVTIAVNTDYTIANATISSNYYSYASNPVGYTHWFNFIPSITGSTTSPVLNNATYQARFMVVGKMCTVHILITFGSTTTYGNGTWYLNMPITPEGNGSNDYRQFGVMWGYVPGDGKVYADIGFLQGNSSQNGMWAYKAGTVVPWAHNQPGTWSSGGQIGCNITYEID